MGRKGRQKQSVVNIRIETAWTINVAALISCFHKHCQGCICMRLLRQGEHSGFMKWWNWQSSTMLCSMRRSCSLMCPMCQNLYVFIYLFDVVACCLRYPTGKNSWSKAQIGDLSHETTALIWMTFADLVMALIAVSHHYNVTLEDASCHPGSLLSPRREFGQ